MNRSQANKARFYISNAGGHYESYFQRANHPSRPLAFWVRYTIFSPRGEPTRTRGELWGIWFDGERHTVTAAKEEIEWKECSFSHDTLAVRIGSAKLDGHKCQGTVTGTDAALRWDLSYTSPTPPLFLLDERLYNGPFPKAKVLIGSPLAAYEGTFTVNGETHNIEHWVGSQNHNWGSKHTDEYAWGQVAGFDNNPEAFLELSTARIQLGPVKTPWLTPIVLRLGNKEYRLNGIAQAALRTRAHYDFFDWTFASHDAEVEIKGHIHASRDAFAALSYANPPGGFKTCLNSKIAACTVTVTRRGEQPIELATKNRAAFEILTERVDHGVKVL